MNFSYFLLREFLDIFSYITLAIRGLGETLFNKNICFSELILNINNNISINNSSIDIFSLDGIIKSLVTFGILNLVITYSIRYVLVKVFVLLSPFAFLTLATKPTSIIFKVTNFSTIGVVI